MQSWSVLQKLRSGTESSNEYNLQTRRRVYVGTPTASEKSARPSNHFEQIIFIQDSGLPQAYEFVISNPLIPLLVERIEYYGMLFDLRSSTLGPPI